MKITEKRPNGKGSTKDVLEWVEDLNENASDVRGLYKVMIPHIKQAFRYTFSEANPNHWVPLGMKYKAWKGNQGFPTTIGVLTEAMRDSWIQTPRIKMNKKTLHYTFDNTKIGYAGKPLVDYIYKFNDKRPILTWPLKWIRKNMKKVVLSEWLKKNKEAGE